MRLGGQFAVRFLYAGMIGLLTGYTVDAHAKPAPSVKILTERCAQEAQDAGIAAGGEFNNYVKDCVRDLQDLRKQGLDLDGTHEDPTAVAPPPKPKAAAKTAKSGKVKKKKAKSAKKKKPR